MDDVLDEPLTEEDMELVRQNLEELERDLEDKRDKEIRSGM